MFLIDMLQDRDLFFTLIEDELLNCSDNVILGGDFNTTPDSLDRSGVTVHTNNYCVEKLKHVTAYDLNDVWRSRNRDCSVFSRKQVRDGVISQSRIDYFLVSRSFSIFVQKVYYHDTSFSDHGIVNLKLDLDQVEKGPGLGILNNQFLFEDEYVLKIRNLICNKKKNELFETDLFLGGII